MRTWLILLAAAVAALLVACGEEDGASPTPGVTPQASPTPVTELCGRALRPAPAEGNVFPNGGFEQGHDPWFALKPPDFLVSQGVAHSGSASALLRMRAPVEASGIGIHYLVQEAAPAQMPEVVSGYYRVDNWISGTPKQYLQFVVIAPGPDNFPTDPPNYQIRYLLAGIDQDPFAISNAKFVYLTKEDPPQGKWVYFERNLREDFQKLWGAVPEGFDCLRFLFEVRFDDKVSGDGPAEADVYYDDLYLGPAPAPQ